MGVDGPRRVVEDVHRLAVVVGRATHLWRREHEVEFVGAVREDAERVTDLVDRHPFQAVDDVGVGEAHIPIHGNMEWTGQPIFALLQNVAGHSPAGSKWYSYTIQCSSFKR